MGGHRGRGWRPEEQRLQHTRKPDMLAGHLVRVENCDKNSVRSRDVGGASERLICHLCQHQCMWHMKRNKTHVTLTERNPRVILHVLHLK